MAGFPIKALGNDITKYSRIIVQNLDRIIGYEFLDRNYLDVISGGCFGKFNFI